MREIKFRAWWKASKIMLNNVQDFYDTLGDKRHGNEYEPVNSFGCILEEPDEYIVMQYTGLHDKNGKEIYEGDIVKTVYTDYKSHNGEVYFQGFRLGWAVKHGKHTNQDLFVYSLPDCSIEVIGNIYQDSHLLDNN